VTTVAEAWEETESAFRRARLHYGHGTHNARDEAAWLICHAARIDFDELSARLDDRIDAAVLRRIRSLAARRVMSREPLAYLLREAWLGPYRFYVDRRVIVPRSFIAELMPAGLRPWLTGRRVKRILDLCTGSGCLAIVAALAYPQARVDGLDLSAPALVVAKRNVVHYRLRRRVRLLRSDLFAAVPGERYDLIVCNPPYVKDASMRKLPEEYRHEPALALTGGCDGLDLVRHILDEAPQHLSTSGVLVVEIGHNRAALERAYSRMPFTWLDTSAGKAHVFLLRRQDFPERNLEEGAGEAPAVRDGTARG
jgi:ribosomal protein L3 glutamine methyltransferase